MMWKNFGKYYRISEDGEVQSNFSGQWKTLKQKKSKTDSRGGFYMTVSIVGGHKRVHYIMWEEFVGPRTKGMVIDHINRDRTDNRLANLREVTVKENHQNRNVRKKNELESKNIASPVTGGDAVLGEEVLLRRPLLETEFLHLGRDLRQIGEHDEDSMSGTPDQLLCGVS